MTIADTKVANFIEDVDEINLEDTKDWLLGYKYASEVKDWEVCFVVNGQSDLPKEEVGEFQGFVSFYPEEICRPVLPAKFKKIKNVVGISYGRYPKAARGQMSRAVRQACMEMRKIKRDMVIVALIHKKNVASVRTVEHACFDDYGIVTITDKDGTFTYSMFILNWEKLKMRLHSPA